MSSNQKYKIYKAYKAIFKKMGFKKYRLLARIEALDFMINFEKIKEHIKC